jgi:hypothetical protein
MRLMAFITEAAPIERSLAHIGGPPRPPSIASRRWAVLLRWGTSPNTPGSVVRCFSVAHPPALEGAPEPIPDWYLLGQPEPDVEFDQRVSW